MLPYLATAPANTRRQTNSTATIAVFEMPNRYGKRITRQTMAGALGTRSFRDYMRSIGKGWTAVAKLSGFTVGYLRQQYCAGFSSFRVRARIEDKLNSAIWSKPAAFTLRQRQRALLGLDPVFATRTELQALARNVGLTGATHIPNRRTLLEQLSARCAAVRRSIVPSTSSQPSHD